MAINRETIQVNITLIDYGVFKGLAIATPVAKPTEVLVTLPAIERMLKLRADSARDRLRSQSLKAAIEKVSKKNQLGKAIDATTSLVKVQNCPEAFKLPDNRIISATPFDVLVLLVQVEARKNDAAFDLAIAGFADSFLSIAREQLKQQLSLGDRLQLLSSWQDLLSSLRAMQPEELEDLIESCRFYPESTLQGRMRWIKLLRANDMSINHLEALGRSGYLSAFLAAKYTPPIESEARQANLLEMAELN